MKRFGFLFAWALMACSPGEQTKQDDAPPAAANAAPSPNTLTAEGLGALRIGMSKAEVVAAVGASTFADADAEACSEYHPPRAPEGVFVMLEDGVLTRITLSDGAAILSDHRLGVGASAEGVESAYGAALQSSPHQYEAAPARYLTVWTAPRPAGEAYVNDASARGIRYEIGGNGKVHSVHAGGPSIQYVEGCS